MKKSIKRKEENMLNINDLKNILTSSKEIEKAFNDLMIALYEHAREEQKAYIEELEERENDLIEKIKELTEELNDKNDENETLKEDTENIKSELEDIAGLIEDISDKLGWIL